ncbi:phage integrase Arm DNA-binding domain-containing protein [Photobacterium sp. 1_MG-2023]|uniref:phage integrase Arm DNA-binding domain-containing protein n=1 Tax=Photobacterium sp. 1_MG-2023 TaxID=3062646 RepID=UPI0026E37B3F|nr:phage integrase Arm DNA-binding domain-containing protein [Photobacterium sp. 1_MG-2023]MDO6707961.1 phage integrase Arm DNA-binding domain-containing protein [Photobacterium sp. 1_MG-2023]
MAARPRSHNITTPNLYQKLDKRSGKVYYQYRDSRSGKFHGLGTDKNRAVAVAKELNLRISEQLVEQYQHILDVNPAKVAKKGISTKQWCEKYMEIQQERLDAGEIALNTLKNRKQAVKILLTRCKSIGIKELNTKTLAAIIDEYKKNDKPRMAQTIRAIWIDVFKEAQHAGEVESGYNPALATRSPKAEVKRSRLRESDWEPIIAAAKSTKPPYVAHAMMLALTTGLRREDICNLKFKDVRDGFLYVATGKSRGKTKLAFPLNLTNPLLGISLEEIISMCRSNVVAPFILHQKKRLQRTQPGDPIKANRLSRHFAEVRDNTGLTWEGAPPSFHELRSLAERTYSKMGIDTQLLLGHRDRRMTDKYADIRGAEYVVVGG